MRTDGSNNSERNYFSANISRTIRRDNVSGKVSIAETENIQESIPDNSSDNPKEIVSEINPRPTYKAEIKRRIFNAPIEDAEAPNTFTPAVNDAAADVMDGKTKTVKIFGDAELPHFIRKQEEPKKDAAPLSDYSQLKLSGFDTSEKDVISEVEVERNLKKSRSEKAKDFVMEAEIPFVPDMKTDDELQLGSLSPSNRRAAFNYLKKEHKSAVKKAAIVLAAGLVLALLSLFFAGESSYLAEKIGPEMYILINFVILLAAVLSNSYEIKSGINSIIKMKANSDAALVLIWAAAILHNVLAFNEADAVFSSVPLYSATALLVSVPVFAAKCLTIQKTMKALSSMPLSEVRYAAARIPDRNSAHEIGQGIEGDDPSIYYNAKTKAFKDFLAISLKHDASAMLCAVLVPAGLVTALFVAVVTGVKLHDFTAAAAAFALSLCALMPISSALSLVIKLINENAKLSASKSALLTYNGAAALTKSNAVILNAVDIFTPQDCVIFGIKPFNGVRMDDSIIYAASLMIKSEGPLSAQFADVVRSCSDALLPVESLGYEDKLGLSAWIDDKYVLIGTLDHLALHNVELPESDFYSRHCTDGRKPLFLAVDNTLAAMFIVGYEIKDELAEKLRRITENGITLIVQTSDPNISEEFVENSLGLHKNTVRVINRKNGEYYKIFRNQINDSLVTHNFHNGKTASFLNLIISSFDLAGQKSTVFAVFAAALLTGAALLITFAFTQSVFTLDGLHIFAFQSFWFAVSLIIPRLGGMFHKLFS